MNGANALNEIGTGPNRHVRAGRWLPFVPSQNIRLARLIDGHSSSSTGSGRTGQSGALSGRFSKALDTILSV